MHASLVKKEKKRFSVVELREAVTNYYEEKSILLQVYVNTYLIMSVTKGLREKNKIFAEEWVFSPPTHTISFTATSTAISHHQQ